MKQLSHDGNYINLEAFRDLCQRWLEHLRPLTSDGGQPAAVTASGLEYMYVHIM